MLKSGQNYFPLMERGNFFKKFVDQTYDPFFEEYKENLVGLNAVVASMGEKLEGNIFYSHNQKDYSTLSSRFLNKRRTLALASHVFKNIVEIGFNAGHSALLMLTANPRLYLTYIDMCAHKYTIPCFEHLYSIFGERIKLIAGNSSTAFPTLAAMRDDYDLYIIDGGHGIEIADCDIHNTIYYGRPGSIIMFDDSQNLQFKILLESYMLSGQLLLISDQYGLLKSYDQMFFINQRRK